MNLRRIAIAAVILTGWSLGAAAQAQTTLRYKFKAGDTLHYVLDQNMKMTMNIMGKEIETLMDQSALMTWSVLSVDDAGSARMKVSFGRTKIKMSTPMGKTEIDSDSSQEPTDAVGGVLYQVVKAMAGLEMTATVSPRGDYSDVKVPDKAVESIKRLPGSEQFGEMLSPEGLKRMMSQSGLALPKDAVANGSMWKHTNSMKMPFGKMNVELEATYSGQAEKDGRTLEKIALKPKATLEPAPNAAIVMKLKSMEGAGTAWFDNTLGRLIEVAQRQSTEMEVEVGGMTFSMRMSQATTMRLTPKK